MKKMKLIRMIVNIVLLVSAVTCFIVAGVKTSQCIKYGQETNACTSEINQTMYDNLTDFNTPGTSAYIKIQELSAERDEANANYEKWENGIMGFAIAGFISTFALVFLVVNNIKSKY